MGDVQTLRDRNSFYSGAAPERILPNASYAVWDADFCQPGAVQEGITVNLGHTVGDMNLL